MEKVDWLKTKYWDKVVFNVKEENLPEYEKQSHLQDYDDNMQEYIAMVIQYGGVTLFATAFPPAALFAGIHNMIIIRTNAMKILKTSKRPHYRGAQDIGVWYTLLDLTGFAAVITNCLLIGFSYTSFRDWLSPTSTCAFAVLAAIVILEHALIGIKFLIAEVIPDMPSEVLKALGKQDFCKSQMRRLLRIQLAKEQKSEFDESSLYSLVKKTSHNNHNHNINKLNEDEIYHKNGYGEKSPYGYEGNSNPKKARKTPFENKNPSFYGGIAHKHSPLNPSLYEQIQNSDVPKRTFDKRVNDNTPVEAQSFYAKRPEKGKVKRVFMESYINAFKDWKESKTTTKLTDEIKALIEEQKKYDVINFQMVKRG